MAAHAICHCGLEAASTAVCFRYNSIRGGIALPWPLLNPVHLRHAGTEPKIKWYAEQSASDPKAAQVVRPHLLISPGIGANTSLALLNFASCCHGKHNFLCQAELEKLVKLLVEEMLQPTHNGLEMRS